MTIEELINRFTGVSPFIILGLFVTPPGAGGPYGRLEKG